MKISVTIDPGLLDQTKALTGSDNVSDLIDQGLALIIEREQHKQWVDGYLRHPQGHEESDWAELADGGAIDDDTDWEALYLGETRRNEPAA